MIRSEADIPDVQVDGSKPRFSLIIFGRCLASGVALGLLLGAIYGVIVAAGAVLTAEWVHRAPEPTIVIPICGFGLFIGGAIGLIWGLMLGAGQGAVLALLERLSINKRLSSRAHKLVAGLTGVALSALSVTVLADSLFGSLVDRRWIGLLGPPAIVGGVIIVHISWQAIDFIAGRRGPAKWEEDGSLSAPPDESE